MSEGVEEGRRSEGGHVERSAEGGEVVREVFGGGGGRGREGDVEVLEGKTGFATDYVGPIDEYNREAYSLTLVASQTDENNVFLREDGSFERVPHTAAFERRRLRFGKQGNVKAVSRVGVRRGGRKGFEGREEGGEERGADDGGVAGRVHDDLKIRHSDVDLRVCREGLRRGKVSLEKSKRTNKSSQSRRKRVRDFASKRKREASRRKFRIKGEGGTKAGEGRKERSR